MKIVAKKIEMIASFRQDGLIAPHRFKISESKSGQNDELNIIHVDKVIKTEEKRLAGIKTIIFTCESRINNIARLYEIKYRIEEHRWELYKQ